MGDILLHIEKGRIPNPGDVEYGHVQCGLVSNVFALECKRHEKKLSAYFEPLNVAGGSVLIAWLRFRFWVLDCRCGACPEDNWCLESLKRNGSSLSI